jgi:putative ABC transport system permease protein
VETWNGGRGELQSMVMATTSGVGVVAIPRGSTLFAPRVVAGRWLSVSAAPEIVMNQQAMDLYRHPALGSRQQLALHGDTLEATLVGVVQDLEKAKIYVDQAVYDAAANPRHDVNSVMFVVADASDESVRALKRDIEAALAPSDLSVLYVMSQAERVKVIYDHLNIVLSALIILSFSVLMVSTLGMASASGVSILERTREIGVMRAIGATPTMIYRLFVAEGMMASMASVVLGLLLAWPLSKAACATFGTLMLGEGASLRYTFSVQGFVITLATTLLFGWSASRGPARRAVAVSTREALAYS